MLHAGGPKHWDTISLGNHGHSSCPPPLSGAEMSVLQELEMTDDLMEGDGWEGAEGAAAAATQLPTEGGVHSHQCAVDDFEGPFLPHRQNLLG